jgi:hypothetical protein
MSAPNSVDQRGSSPDFADILEGVDGFADIDDFIRQRREVTMNWDEIWERQQHEINYCRRKLAQLREKFTRYRLPLKSAATPEGEALVKLLYEQILIGDVTGIELTILHGADVSSIRRIRPLNLLYHAMLCTPCACQAKVVLLLLAAGTHQKLPIRDQFQPTTALQFAMEHQNNAPICALLADGGVDPYVYPARPDPVVACIANSNKPMHWLPCLLQHGLLRDSVTDATWRCMTMAVTTLQLWVDTARVGHPDPRVDAAAIVRETARAFAVLLRVMTGERQLKDLPANAISALFTVQDIVRPAVQEDAWDRRRCAVWMFTAASKE